MYEKNVKKTIEKQIDFFQHLFEQKKKITNQTVHIEYGMRKNKIQFD